jgi:hypothetical protein
MRDEVKPLPEARLRNKTCPNFLFNCYGLWKMVWSLIPNPDPSEIALILENPSSVEMVAVWGDGLGLMLLTQ